MRRFASVSQIFFLIGTFCVPPSIAAKTIQQSETGAQALTNQDVLSLMKAGLATEIIIAKLQRSTCRCDTSPAELQRLKDAGVPDDILVAMVESSKPARFEMVPVTIPARTKVELETAYRISSQEIKPGEAITFRVVNPVKIGDSIVISSGAVATGRVVKATRGGHFGRAGRLVWTMETVTAVDGSAIPIDASERIVGDSKGAKVTTQIILTGALLWPIAPVALLHGFKRGENAYLAQGRRYDVVISKDTTIKVTRAR